jgi:hypothetical protein
VFADEILIFEGGELDGGIPANRNPRMRRPRIDMFAFQL